MRRRVPPVPEHLKHVIVTVPGGFELRTHQDYLLKAFRTIEEARAYYAWHCPADL